MSTIKISQLPIYPGALSSSAIFPTVAGNTTYQVTASNIANLVTSNITTVGTLTSLSVSGNTTSGNLLSLGAISAVGNVQGNYIKGNGSLLTGVVTGNADAIANGTSNIHISVASGPITAGVSGISNVVVLTSLGSFVNGFVSASGNVIAANFIGNITGNIASATTAGTVTSNAQGNITSVGVLTSLSVSGNITGGNVVTSGIFTGNGVGITNLIGANVVGPVATATAAQSAVTAGNVTNAAQANITSVGTLTSLTVSTTNSNIGTAGSTVVNNGFFKLPSYTTAQIGNLTGMTGGEMVFNSTLGIIQVYQTSPAVVTGWTAPSASSATYQ